MIQAMIPGSASIILETDENGAREIHDIIGRCHGRMLRREARWRTPAQAAPSVAFTGADEYTEAPAGQRSDTHHGRAR